MDFGHFYSNDRVHYLIYFNSFVSKTANIDIHSVETNISGYNSYDYEIFTMELVSIRNTIKYILT